MKSKETILSIIVFSQFCCTSMWFASNAVLNDLIAQFQLDIEAVAYLSNAVQLGFIFGTLLLSIFSIADRYSPSLVFITSAIIGSIFNVWITFDSNTYFSLLLLRFLVGFFLAGIYPVGMKIASDYFKNGLGKSLSYLVAALVLGTSFPHLVRFCSVYFKFEWQVVVYFTSAISILGGVLVYGLIQDGPYRKAAQKIDFTKFITIFDDKKYKSFTLGYVGHMWEVYAFWVFVPLILSNVNEQIDVSLWSFIVIAAGGIGCIIGGKTSSFFGNKNVALFSLACSGLCCFIYPFIANQNFILIIILLIIWGMVVISDSPLFSALVAKSAPEQYRGTALTIATFLGFLTTIVSIQLLSYLTKFIDSPFVYWVLLLGPILGISSVFKQRKTDTSIKTQEI